MPAIQATRFHSQTASSFIASKLGSYKGCIPAEITGQTRHEQSPKVKRTPYLWEPGLPAIQATRFHSQTASSFIASKLGSYKGCIPAEITGQTRHGQTPKVKRTLYLSEPGLPAIQAT
ncbi:hypothetical protein [Pseudomonas caspiana]|uniref:hypothetical protein n=1 Tax=Pseudomonas caspiana TaxID=1451454 RepID=UPI003557572B